MKILSLKTTALAFLLLCLTFITPSHSQSDQKINSVQQCNSLVKSQFIKKISALKTNTQLQQTIQKTFPADRNLLFRGISQNKAGLIWQSVKGKQGSYVIHIGIVMLFGIFHLILIPIFQFTRCCQRCCRPSPNKSYNACNLCWPATIAIILLLALVAISALVINTNRDFESNLLDMKCSLGVISDDMLQGGSYDDQRIRFIGLRKYRYLFDNFTEKLASINKTVTSFSQNSTMLNSFNKKMVQIQKLVKNVPSNNNNRLVLQYSHPLTSKQSELLAKQPSKFPEVLGTSKQSLTLLGNFSQSVKQTKQKINLLANFSANFSNFVKNIQKQSIKSRLREQINLAENIEFNIINTATLFQKGFWKAYLISTYAILGFTILFGLLLFCGLICLAGNRKYRYRRHATLCCIVIWGLGLAHFILAIALSLGNTAIVHSCQYLREGFSSQQAFKQNLITPFTSQIDERKDIGRLFINETNIEDINSTMNETIRKKTDNTVIQFENITKLIRKCLKSSKQPDDIYWNIVSRNFDNISRLSSYLTGYNPQQYTKTLQKNFTNLLSTVERYRTAQILDIDNLQMVKQLQNMAKSQPCFPDNWVPSLNQLPQKIPCVNNKTQIADSSTCKIETQFRARSANCTGCIDTFLILQRYKTRQEVLDSLLQRYNTCSKQNREGIIDNLTNIWTNFYLPKKDIIGKVKERLMTINQPLNQTKKLVISLNKPFSQTFSWLEEQPLIKPPTQMEKDQSYNAMRIKNNSADNEKIIQAPGIKKLMDCRVFGWAFQNALNYSCTKGMQYLYILRIFYIVTALISFFVCFLTVWTTSRFYQQKLHTKYLKQNANIQYQNPTTDIRLSQN